MKIYYVYPSLTACDSELAKIFFDISFKEIEEHIEVVRVMTKTVLSSIEFSKDDGVVFFNNHLDNYEESFKNFLNSAKEMNLDIFPIALDANSRMPSQIVGKSQSYDVIDALRQRNLTTSNITTVAYAFSRTVISQMQPTLSKEDIHIFISHRRIDGEEIAATFYNEFRIRAQSAFRDLIDIKVGEDAQSVIEVNLRNSDVVVFLDTPKSGESIWINKEISLALALNIPIVWVRIGNVENRVRLEVLPAETPHFYLDDNKIARLLENPEIIDDIIHKAFRLSRQSAQLVFDQLHLMKKFASDNGISIKKIDSKNMLYRLDIPRKGFKYYQNPIIQLIQCYGRQPRDLEYTNIETILGGLGYLKHPEFGSNFDSALLLAPKKYCDVLYENQITAESFEDYLTNLDEYLNPNRSNKLKDWGIIISGAFPDCEPDYQQNITDAVYSFTKIAFQNNGTVIFGAHPTFQNLIFDMGKMYCPESYKDLTHLYVSKFFLAQGGIDELNSNAKVVATEVVNSDRKASLTLLRETMISDKRAIALICIGGKTKSGISSPGVDEEIKIARSKGIPVFIIGSVGGRSAELANQYNQLNWNAKINNLSIEDNIELMNSVDYFTLSRKILKSLDAI